MVETRKIITTRKTIFSELGMQLCHRAVELVSDEDAVLDDVPALGGDAFVVVADATVLPRLAGTTRADLAVTSAHRALGTHGPKAL